jgi:hypothetical protein
MAFSAHEVASIAGISKNTLLRWLKQRKVPEVCRDRNGWRIFDQHDVDRICAFAHATTPPGGCPPSTGSAALRAVAGAPQRGTEAA